MSDGNIYPPRLLKAYYNGGQAADHEIIFQFEGGYMARYFTGEKFPMPGAPIVHLFPVEGAPKPKVRFSGYLPVDGKQIKREYDSVTDDPILVNLSLEMLHAVDSGRFRAGTQVWPPPA